MSESMELGREQLKQLNQDSLIELMLALQEQLAAQQVLNLALQEQLAAQQVLIQELRDQLAKDSHNSSKPPSSDGLSKRRSQSLRQSGVRPRGGQPGHKGQTLAQVAEPQHVIRHALQSCPHCQTDLTAVAAVGQVKRQVFDIPPLGIEVTEHQAEFKQCPGCGVQVKGTFPAHVTQPTQYGLRLKAQASYLNSYHFIPLARTTELLTDFYGQGPSEAVVIAANRQLVIQTRASRVRIQQQIRTAPVVNFDESGLRVEERLQWLHVASTAKLTHYHAHAKRGQVGMQAAGILSRYRGVAVHDHWASYLQFRDCQHAFCNAHHLRELLFIHERYDQEWAAEMAHLLRTIKTEVASTAHAHEALPPERLAHYDAEYDTLIAQGLAANPPPAQTQARTRGRPKQAPPKNLLDRLRTHKSGVLRFMYDFRIPFDNNQAERDVRMIKVQQKVSGAFRTHTGADTFCALRSYISTVRKHGHNVIDALYNAFLDQPFIPSTEQA